MKDIYLISRRELLRKTGIAGGAFILGSSLGSCSTDEKTTEADNLEGDVKTKSALGYFVSISSDGSVDIICHRAEMGQGILTSVPQMIADELEADWDKVSVSLATGDSKYGDQSTGGSNSIRSFFKYTRKMGSLAKVMLEQAAALTWGVDVKDVFAENHSVVNKLNDERLGFGELAAEAAKLPVPDAESLVLKPLEKFKLIGKDVKLSGQRDIVTGKATYAQDIQVEGLLIASIQRPPVIGTQVKSFDASEALKVSGVVDVIQLKVRELPLNVKPLGGVAVVATHTWAAIEGRKKLKIEWTESENHKHQSEVYKQGLVEKVQNKGIGVHSKGDVYSHQYNPALAIEATYTVPYHHHMSMETPAATAYKEGDKWVIWTGTQSPQWGKGMVMAELGLNPEQDQNKLEFNLTLMGGAFGRKGKNDFTIEAVELANKTGKPIKVIWTREDDVKHGFYHAIAANYFKAELAENKTVDNWIQRVAHSQISWIFNSSNDQPGSQSLSQSFLDIPFKLKHLSCETQKSSNHIRTGWFRSVHNIHNAFAMSCFVDELAVKAGVSTQKMWLNLLAEDRFVNPAEEGLQGWSNYGLTEDEHPLSTRRMKQTINLLCDQAGVNEPGPKDEAWGIAFASSFNSYAAAATKVRVAGNKLEVLEMHTAIDCGIVVTPDRVRSQMEGAMIMGLSMALKSEISIKDGAIEQSNFHDYPVSRMNEVPPLFVHLVDSKDAPGGVGEPGLPPVMPSITNAIFHASGVRVRDLPVNKVFQV